MPHFTRQFHNHAPVVDAVFHISEPRLRLLTAGGREPPRPVVGQALLDTGAGCTCVDPAVTYALGLEPRGVEDVYTPSTGDDPHTTTQYDLSIIIPPASAQDAPLVLKAFPVIHSELLRVHGLHALIGRDVLRRCIFHYEGAVEFFSLAW